MCILTSRTGSVACALGLAAFAPCRILGSQAVQPPAIPVLQSQSFTLANGLTVVLHEDHKAPIANVYVAYKAGSAAEHAGKTGLAHLFEHLMFRGTEHASGDYSADLARLGATDVGGVTHQDYTRYFETVPAASLATALWMEAERMCCLPAALTQSTLDEEKRVVRNEIQEGENQAYGRASALLLDASYPAGHRYSWPAVGDVADLERVTLDDLRAFFRTYYAPNNAVLVVTGDFAADSARAIVERYFASIPSGIPVPTLTGVIAPASSSRHVRIEDRVPAPRLTIAWNVPGLGTAEYDHLRVVADFLGGPDSPLTRRLVARDRIATNVGAWIDARATSSSFIVQVDANAGADLPPIEAVVDEELRLLARAGPTDAELALVKRDYVTSVIRRLERLGGFGGESDEIGTNVVFSHDAGAHLVRAARVEHTSVDTVRAEVTRWLRVPSTIIEWVPAPRRAMAAAGSRPGRPVQSAVAPPVLAGVERARLRNGADVLLVRRPGNQMISMQLLIPSGSSAEAALAMAALTQATTDRSAPQFASDLRAAGATLQGRADPDYCTLTVAAPRSSFAGAVRLAARAVVAPAFAPATLDRLKQDQVRRAAQATAGPAGAWRPLIFAALVGGDGAASVSATASGAVRREDVVAFHTQWIRPDSATFIIAGDIAMPDVIRLLESEFQQWRSGRAPSPAHATAAKLVEPIIYLVDRPSAAQTDITVAIPLPARDARIDAAIDVFVNVLGAGASSRLSQDLRVEKGWAYSPGAGVLETRGQRVLLVRAPVRSDAAADAVREIRSLIRQLADTRPITAQELDDATSGMTRSLAGRWETTDAVGNSVAQIVRAGIPVGDYWTTYAMRIAAVTADDVTAIARAVDGSRQWVWVVVGNRSRLEGALRDASGGKVMTP